MTATALSPAYQPSLCEILDRILAKGVVADGEIVLAVAGVDLVSIRLALLIASVGESRSPLLAELAERP